MYGMILFVLGKNNINKHTKVQKIIYELKTPRRLHKKFNWLLSLVRSTSLWNDERVFTFTFTLYPFCILNS